MTTVVFSFPAGLYHATPWGHHVNEGLVEWPPSPWRLLRALISVGHTALHWDDGVPAVARTLIEALASVAPHYVLPEAGVAHTRHYMPIGGKTTLVFDAFARPGDEKLAVTWPVALDNEQRALLGQLVHHMNYLGRSESWVEGRLLPSGQEAPAGEPCRPSEGAQAPGRGWEQVQLLRAEPAHAYASWRAAMVTASRNDASAATGLRGRPKRPSGGVASAEEALPPDLWGCLGQTTADLQAAGWSHPPGSHRILYWRRSDALAVSTPPAQLHTSSRREETVLFSLSLPSGNLHALPPVTRTLPLAEILHRTAVSLLGNGERVALGEELVGRDLDGNRLRGHRHAHVLPLDLDGDGHIDHILFWAPGGFGPKAQEVLKRLRRTWARGLPDDLHLAISATGPAAGLTSVPGTWGDGLRSVIGPSRTWRSETPFLPPRYLKPRGTNTLEGQVQAELTSRGFPKAAEVQAFSRDKALDAGFRHFVRSRRFGDGNKSGHWYGLGLRFDREIQGPVCLGYAGHFGMGRFRSIQDPHQP